MRYKPYNVRTYYTGGNIWVFTGNVSNDKWFSTANPDWFIDIYDADPDTYDEETDDFLSYEWQEEHRIDSLEDDDFCIDVLKQAIKVDPYNDRDFEYLLRYDFNVNESVSKNVIKKRGKSDMKLKIVEGQLNEGPGAGYTIHVDGLSNFNITSAKVTEYVEESGWFVDVDGTCAIDNLNADSYYYGTGIIHDVDARIKRIWVNWYWVDEYDDLSSMSADELARFMADYAKYRLDDTDFETVYGGGWLHSTYDGTIDAVDSEHGDIDLVITDKHVIDYIDLAVQGENCNNVYYVTSDVDGTLEALDDEDKAIEVAKMYFETGDYDTITVERDLEYYDIDGMPIETFNDTEVIWNSDDEY